MVLSRSSRTITLAVALATLTSNALSLLLCYQLPEDPIHLARNFGLYLHFANVLSVFGFIGTLRQHALSIAIFANYLILDTILCAIPRLLLLGLLHSLSSTLCTDPSPLPQSQSQITTQTQPNFPPSALAGANSSPLISHSLYTPSLSLSISPPSLSCERVVLLAQLTLAAGVVVGTILQFVGALQVRGFARALWVKERCLEEEEGRVVVETNGSAIVEERGFVLPVIRDDLDGKGRSVGNDSKA